MTRTISSVFLFAFIVLAGFAHASELINPSKLTPTEYCATTLLGTEDLIGNGPAIQTILTRVAKAAPTDATILITGETGTGKERIAKLIHQNSKRKDAPFVAINCTAIVSTLVEAEFFGYERGAFTGALKNKKGLFDEADGGTIFLDEIGDLSLETQAKLLRVLQERQITPVGSTKTHPINVRVITATHHDLQADVKAGKFREDLYYRLNVIPIRMPALRQRPEDIVPLAAYFLKKYVNLYSKTNILGFDDSAEALLQDYLWPGNVRELENTMERAVVLSNDGPLSASDFGELNERTTTTEPFSFSLSKLVSLDELTKMYLEKLLIANHNNLLAVSKIIALNRSNARRVLKKYSLNTEEAPSDPSPPTNTTKTVFRLSSAVTLEELKIKYLHAVLLATNNNHSEAARILGVHRRTLILWTQKYPIP